MNKSGNLVEALRSELAAKERELEHRKLVLKRFQQSPSWRFTAPVRWVVNQLRGLRHNNSELSVESVTRKDLKASDSLESLAYFTGLCRISLENFFTTGATLELPHPDQSTMSGVLRELRAKDREIEDQKWVLARFMESPAWRWTAPIRWIATRASGSTNGQGTDDSADWRDPDGEAPGMGPAAETSEAKTYFSEMCRKALEAFFSSKDILELPCSPTPTVSIVVVLYNRADLTFACLRSIALHSHANAEVVIVDNDSRDETPSLLERIKGARVIRNSTNVHFLAAANQAARECRGDYILLLNNDAHLIAGAVESAVETIRSSSDIGAVGGKIILIDGTLQEAGSIVWKDGSCAGYGRGDDPFAPMYSFRRDVDYCSGAFLLTPRKTWEELGGFDAVFKPAYYEETDYCMRLWQRGLRVVYEPAAAILHYEFASSKDPASATSLQARNQLIFEERHRAVLQEHENASADRMLFARARNAERRILVIDDRIPHPWLGSGFPRAHALHKVLQRLRYFVTLYPIDVISEPWDQAYEDFPREVEVMMGMGRRLLELFLRVRQNYYQTIIVSRPHNMQLLEGIRKAHPEWFSSVHVLYDAEALFAEREITRRQVIGKPMSDKEVRDALSSEISLAAAADCIITVSENERQTFLKHGIRQVDVLGHSLNAVPVDVPFEVREGLLFVGAVHSDNSPNADSLVWFLSEVYPRIREKLGDVSFTIAGLNRSERIREMAREPVRVVGHVSPAELAGLYARARVFVAPTRYAAGMPHKIHEAAAYGLPVVGTPLLASQLDWTGSLMGIGATAGSFADLCIEIHSNSLKWNDLRKAALDRVSRECSADAFEKSVVRILSRSQRER